VLTRISVSQSDIMSFLTHLQWLGSYQESALANIRERRQLAIATTNCGWAPANDDGSSMLRVFVAPIHWQWIYPTLAGICAIWQSALLSCFGTRYGNGFSSNPRLITTERPIIMPVTEGFELTLE